MKYHSPMKIILLSLILLVVFVSVSLFVTVYCDAPSVTRFALEELTSRLEEGSDELSFSFDRLDSRMRGQIRLEGIHFTLGEREIAHAEDITLRSGFLNTIKAVILGKGDFDVLVKGLEVTVPKDVLRGETDKAAPETESVDAIGEADGPTEVVVASTEPAELPNFNFLVDIVDMRIVLEGLITVEDADLSALYRLSSGTFNVELDIPGITYENADFTIALGGLKAKADGTLDSVNASLASSLVSFATGNINVDAEDLALSLKVPSFSDMDILEMPMGLSCRKVEFEQGEDIYVKADPISLIFRDKEARFSIKSLMGAVGSFAFNSSDIFMGYGLEDNKVSLSLINANLWQGIEEFLTINGVSVGGNALEGVELSAEDIRLPYLGALTGGLFYDIGFTETGVSASWMDGLSFSLSTKARAESAEEVFDGTTFGLSLNGTLDENNAPDAELRITDLYVPSISEKLNAELEYADGDAKLSASMGDSISIGAEYDDAVSADIEFNEFKVETLSALLDRYVPSIKNWYDGNTRLTGRLSADLSQDAGSSIGFRGPVELILALNDISFNKLKLDIVTSSSMELNGEKLDISSFNITSDIVRIIFDGQIDLKSMIPSGNFSILTTDKGKYIADLDLEDLGNKQFSFLLSLFNNRSVELGGIFNFQDRMHLWSDAELSVGGERYGIGFDIDFSSSVVSVVNDRAYFGMTFADGFDLVLSFDKFLFPLGKLGGDPTMADGDISAKFDFESQHFEARMDKFTLANLNFLPGRPDMHMSFRLDETGIRSDELEVVSSEFPTMRGKLEFLFEGKNLSAALESEEERVLFSLTNVENIYSGLLSVENLLSSRFGMDMGLINVRLMGRGSSLDDIGFSGDFSIKEKNEEDGPGLSGKLSVTEDTLRIDNFNWAKGTTSMQIPSLVVSSRQGLIELPFRFDTAMINDDRPYPVSADLKIDLMSEPGENLYEYVSHFIENGLADLSGRIVVNDIRIDNRLCTGSRYSKITSREGILNLEGNFITGTFDPSRMEVDLDINLDPITSLAVEGHFRSGLDLLIGIRDLNLSAINMVMGSPILVITDDSFASGEVYLTGPFTDLKFYGYVWTDKMTCDVFWVPDDTLIAHNGLFILWDNNIRSSKVAVTAVDKFTNARSEAYLTVEVNFNQGLSFDFFQLDCYVEPGKEISLRVPVQSINADFLSQVSGHFILNMTAGEKTFIGGTIELSDFLGSIGMHPLPEWWLPDGEGSNMDFDFTFKKNADIVFPLGPNPIFKATLDEDQHMTLSIGDGGQVKIGGKLKLRSGEIFYFQNFFFIREGSIEFAENDLHALEPVINLRAQLRDFDENGDKIDIWLTLMDGRLDNFNPMVSSSPARDTSEIMSILGQTIVGTDAPSGALGSVVSLVSTGVDVLSRIGIIDMGTDGSLQNSIRTSLNLDAFSLHSNIVENIVFDAFNSWQDDSVGLTPLARYLDGTSLYIGKHLSPEFYFEALAHLVAKKGGSGENVGSFLSSDLSLDIEISVEWDNPLCTARFFTSPSYLNFQEMFDTLGFTLSKRFVF